MSAVPPLPNLDCNVRVGDALAGDGFTEPARARSAHRPRSRGCASATRGPRARARRRCAARSTARSVVRARRARSRRSPRCAPNDASAHRRCGAATCSASRRGRATARASESRDAASARDRAARASDGASPTAARSPSPSRRTSATCTRAVGSHSSSAIHRGSGCTTSRADRAALRARFRRLSRRGVGRRRERARAGAGFAAQVDLAALFVERSLALTVADRARRAAVAGEALAFARRRRRAGAARRRRRDCCDLEDWSERTCAFDAAVYPSVIVAAPAAGGASTRGCASVHVARFAWSGRRVRLDPRSTRTIPASPWLLAPARRASRVRSRRRARTAARREPARPADARREVRLQRRVRRRARRTRRTR